MSEKPFLRPARPGDLRDAAQRAAFIADALRQRAEIEQYFRDVAHWNDHVRKPDEESIDPDPDGTMVCLVAYLKQFDETPA